MHAAHPDRNIRLLNLYWFLRDFQLWIPVWIVFLTLERGFSLTQVTTAEGLFLIGVLILEVPTGAVADRYGRSKSMALGAFVLGGAVLIFAFTSSFAILLASFLLWSLASALMSGADSALLFDTLKAAGREAEYERRSGRGMALSYAGVGIATLLGGPVSAIFDIRLTIFIGAATCMLTSFVALSIWEPPKEPHPHGATTSYFGSIGAAFSEAWRAVDVRILILLAGSAFAAIESVHYLIQPYLVDRGIEVGVTFSLLQVPVLFAGLGGALLADRIARRGGSSRAFLAGPLLGAGCFLALAVAPGLTAYLAFPLLIAIGSCLDPIAAGYINRRIGSHRRATVLSIQSMFRSLILAGLAPGMGFTTDHWGISQSFAVGAAMTAASCLVFGIPFLLRSRRAELTLGEPAFELTEASTAG